MLDAAQGRCTGAAGMSGHHDVIGIGFGNTGSYGSNSCFRNQLHTYAGRRIHLLQILNQLGQVLDAVDIVMGGRADQGHSHLRMAQAGDEFGHFGRGELSALSGLGALCDLDFQLFCLDEVLSGHSKAARGNLLDFVVSVGLRAINFGIFPALACVGLTSKQVHCL